MHGPLNVKLLNGIVQIAVCNILFNHFYSVVPFVIMQKCMCEIKKISLAAYVFILSLNSVQTVSGA